MKQPISLDGDIALFGAVFTFMGLFVIFGIDVNGVSLLENQAIVVFGASVALLILAWGRRGKMNILRSFAAALALGYVVYFVLTMYIDILIAILIFVAVLGSS